MSSREDKALDAHRGVAAGRISQLVLEVGQNAITTRFLVVDYIDRFYLMTHDLHLHDGLRDRAARILLRLRLALHAFLDGAG